MKAPEKLRLKLVRQVEKFFSEVAVVAERLSGGAALKIVLNLRFVARGPSSRRAEQQPSEKLILSAIKQCLQDFLGHIVRGSDDQLMT